MTYDLAKQHFKDVVWEYFRTRGRHDLSWRIPAADSSFDPYKIMVSELMLQQTQVSRVVPKYQAFLQQFPTLQTLAEASLGDVLRAWSGLGYNRRAKFLHQAAQFIVETYSGRFPKQASELTILPGIGVNTAGAILAYAFNQPGVFVETNIRSVFIHHFFDDRATVTDQEIRALVSETLDREHPREWYWALMDYGAYLKQTASNPARRSQTYSQQSPFQGSWRQVRGHVIRLLGARPYSASELQQQIADDRLPSVLDELLAEKLIRRDDLSYHL